MVVVLNKYEWNNAQFLWAGDNLMQEMYLRKLGFTYGACRLFTKNKERV